MYGISLYFWSYYKILCDSKFYYSNLENQGEDLWTGGHMSTNPDWVWNLKVIQDI